MSGSYEDALKLVLRMRAEVAFAADVRPEALKKEEGRLFVDTVLHTLDGVIRVIKAAIQDSNLRN